MDKIESTRFSVLDLVPVTRGNSPADAFRNSLELAQKAEKWNFKRFWISEHHNMESIASSATAILLAYVAGGTSKIRVGSGGILLPNHSPLFIAEQFGTLELLYPGRVDLGLGRTPVTDPKTAMSDKGNQEETPDDFPKNLQELRKYFSAENKNSEIRAIPGEGLEIPLYIVGSSSFSARLAADLGLAYAFASHFAPAYLHKGLELYRKNFKASRQLKKPYSIACVNVIAADTDTEAKMLATSQKLFTLGIIRGIREPMPPPVRSMKKLWNNTEEASIQKMLHYSFIGSPETIETQLSAFINETGIDEIMVASHIYDPEARLKSYEILSLLFNKPKNPFFDPEPK